jgi:hypothetical protein
MNYHGRFDGYNLSPKFWAPLSCHKCILFLVIVKNYIFDLFKKNKNMRISLVFAVVSIWLTSSCGIKKELALMKSKNQQLTEANTDLKNKVISLKDQVSYLDEQIQIIRGSEMIDGVERNDMTDPSNLVLNAAQEMPRFSNKLTFLEFIEERMNLEEMDFEPGTVYIEMVVLEDGTLTNFNPVGASSLAQQAQAVKLLKSSSPWTPGETNGNRVKVRMVMPIIFK